MRFRVKAFGLHLLGSACALSLVLGVLYLGWYRWPGWYLSSALHIVGIVVMVDLVLGPTLTLIVASAGKPRRELTRDIGMIVVVQLAALIYGGYTLWSGRPLYYAFSVNCLEMVQASDIEADERTLAHQQNPSFAPRWSSLPRWIWAPLPENKEAANKIVSGTLFGGKDVIEMPRYFRPWNQGLPKLREQLTPVNNLIFLTKEERKAMSARMAARGLRPDAHNVLIMWGGSRRLVAVFDPATLQLQALLNPDLIS
ncbi:MAG TPA: hypothetical protein VK695_11075 [Steroidobacteraceae bacterium]|jgi:hypothetical protein|nr:hypothetical protein [Steroidobacteraceae bacterium]